MKKNIILTIMAIAAVLILAGCSKTGILDGFTQKDPPSTVVMPLSEYYGISGEDVMIIIDEKVYDKKALWRDDAVYLDLETVKQMYDNRFFWDENEKTMYYGPPDTVYRFYPGVKEYILNRSTITGDRPMIQEKDGTLYICVELLEKYCGITCRIYDDPHRILITYSDEAYLEAVAKEDTQIRVKQDVTKEILKEVKAGDVLRFIDGGGIMENGFVKVMSEDGVRGYIKSNALDESYYADPVFTPFTATEYSHIRLKKKVYLGWQLMYTADNLDYLNAAAALAPEMNVVSPTWFFLSDIEGNMISYANRDYIAAAHNKGLQVWALYKNDTIEGKFECSEDSHKVLSSSESRTKLIDNIVNYAVEYGFDGVNIDFEMLKVDTGVYFIQFLRELAIECRSRGIIISVDNYVPQNYNAYYDLAAQSDIVDYVIIMGYDEHYAGSEEAGSVSSLGWFKDAVANTVAKCDPAGVIMAVPFYTRLWKENGDKLTVESTPSMTEAASIVKKAKAEPEWDEECGQYYAEWKNAGVYRIWLEEEESLRQKVYAAREADTAGIAAWKCGDEKAGIWAVLVDAMEGELPAEETGENTEDNTDENAGDKAAE
ncbi:MAG: hypothetical protein J5824_02365 [Lachnospiraceae bacterium]|nr:hypothetical protein [Lachnospiraceae bacterium]